MREAARLGLATSMHAVGDLGVSEALDLFEAARGEDGEAPRHRLVHARVIAAADIPRIARCDLIVEAQPWEIVEVLPRLVERFGPAFTRTAYAFRSLLDAGARLAFSSDWRIDSPPDCRDADPLLGLYAAVTRAGPQGEARGEGTEAITVAEALECYTGSGAWAACAERRRGRVVPGADADLVALSEDVVAGGPQALARAKVLLTVSAGRTVWEAT